MERCIIGVITLRGYGMGDKRDQVVMRLKRIEGQLRGLQRMVEQQASCADILTQVAAVTAAMKKVGLLILQGYSEECLEQTRGEPPERQAEKLRNFHTAVSRFMNWS